MDLDAPADKPGKSTNTDQESNITLISEVGNEILAEFQENINDNPSQSVNSDPVVNTTPYSQQTVEEKEKVSVVEQPRESNDVVFTTTTEQMPIKVPNRDERTFEIGSQKSIKQYKPVLHLATDNGTYTLDDITNAADNYLKNGKIQLEDSLFIAEIIEELTARYLDLLSDTEYLKANEMIEKARALRREFRMKDASLFWEQRLVDLESKKKELDDHIKVVQREWLDKQKDLLEQFKDEIFRLKEKSNLQRTTLENDWTTAEKQRHFNKQSKALLAGRTLEKYMVLAGDLEAAEAQKRRNKAAEQKEIKSGYAEMANAFEAARDKLEEEIEQREKDLDESQEFRKKKLKTEERHALEYWRKKAVIVEKMIQEEKRVSRTVRERRATSVQSCELPMLKRTVQNIEIKKKILSRANVQARPLALPPLEVKKRAPKKKLDKNSVLAFEK